MNPLLISRLRKLSYIVRLRGVNEIAPADPPPVGGGGGGAAPGGGGGVVPGPTDMICNAAVAPAEVAYTCGIVCAAALIESVSI